MRTPTLQFLTPLHRPHSSHHSPSPKTSPTLSDRTRVITDVTPDLVHPSVATEPRRNAIADEDPNASAAPARRRPRSDDPKPHRRYPLDPLNVLIPF
ncbi:hypothetical protein GUJ93_ZPchr0002g24079 [Zizania palustris]|uniref:Uncharacterized protein n=1 Tax=Zizania palustris TaxID=103762 RepID=A0A8J5VWK3_ZIZPA|nr:hypothetical protein GUJ93_ZPchr0002g24079 [Zizania palustris]